MLIGSLTSSATAQTHLKEEPAGFIFTADKVTNPRDERESIRLRERLPLIQLKKRFSRYEVVSTAGEDCFICANISRGKISISVNYSEDGITITEITSNDKMSADALGNAVGAPLRDAIGARTADCDAGDRTTCASPRLIGLHYIVEGDNCSLLVKDNQRTDIPACAKVGGFQIFHIVKAP
jgi:hypothetical protein